MSKGGLYWHGDAETQINHVYYHGVSLCGRMVYSGPDRHEFVSADEPACPGCIAEARARRDRALRKGIKGAGNGKDPDK